MLEYTIPIFLSISFPVITGMVTAMSPGPKGSLQATVSLIKAYKAGRLTITQAGETMSVKLMITCRKCPMLRRGMTAYPYTNTLTNYSLPHTLCDLFT